MPVSSTSWKPGYRPPGAEAGPKGPRIPLEVRKLKDEAKAEVIKAISAGLLMRKDEIAAVMNDPNATMAQMLVGSVILKAIKEGDMYRFGTLINYVLGKPKPLGSSWHDDAPGSDAQEEQRKSLQMIPSAALLEIVRRQNAAPQSPD